jgi:hypothetical protein
MQIRIRRATGRLSSALGTGVAAALVLASSAHAQIPQPVYFWSSVVQPIDFPEIPNPLVTEPTMSPLSGDGHWVIDQLTWTGWGTSVAVGAGISSASDGIPDLASGHRTSDPATVTLSDPGPFHGREVYRCYEITIPAVPKAAQDGCLGYDDHNNVGLYPASIHHTTQTRLFKALGGKVECGSMVTARRFAPRLLCRASPIPTPKTATSLGLGHFVTLQKTGSPQRIRLHEYAWVQPNPKAAGLTAGDTWAASGVTCTITEAAVRCSNTAGHGFTITRTTYKAF